MPTTSMPAIQNYSKKNCSIWKQYVKNNCIACLKFSDKKGWYQFFLSHYNKKLIDWHVVEVMDT